MQQIQEIAQRIKTLREIMEIPAEEMAQAAGVSVEEYSEYETGKMVCGSQKSGFRRNRKAVFHRSSDRPDDTQQRYRRRGCHQEIFIWDAG